ncbi:putative acetyltransferase [Xanthomonas sacchari]|uniref:GNAT family N-acetyltransferase n=1 Tax=unclassified Xanthomonas TaxID=2643310 RepID=UPI00136F34C1|nr:putative acetyltransferase [Xanthomonas sp. F10]MXV34778.1 GNAT family N-acetyltransferase [Xanthomonas sp. LMG 8989]
MTVGSFVIRPGDLDDPAVRGLLEYHVQQMHAQSPPGSVYALDLSGLRQPQVRVWSVWRDDALAAVGALRVPDAGGGELKSMRTHPAFLRQGAAAALLDHLIALARAEGLQRLSLETGSGAAFEPALALYRRRGFRNGPAFGDYVPSAFNQFLHLELSP